MITELNEHAAAGRLTTEELEERIHAADSARTTGELEALRADLPPSSSNTTVSLSTRRAQLTRRLLQETGGSLGLFVLCTAIWLFSGANGSFWPVWVLIVVLLSLGRSAWALYGPAPDLDHVEARLDARRDKRVARERRRSDFHRDFHRDDRSR